MRMSDWSSDVCSSDLFIRRERRNAVPQFDSASLPGADPEHNFRDQEDSDQCPKGQILDKTGTKLGKVDVQHHDYEEEENRDRANINDDQQHGDELRLDRTSTRLNSSHYCTTRM